MTALDPPKPDARQALTRRRVLEAALELVDRDGAEALTMRRLGGELGVAAMSLYNHVSGREELLDGLSEVLVGRIGVQQDAAAPDAALRQFMHGIRAVAVAHPDAFRLVGMRPLHTPDALVPVERALAALRTMGLADDEVVHAYRAAVSYARGFALAEIAGFSLEARDGADNAATHPADLSAGSYPTIVALAAPLAAPDRDAAFDFGVDALVVALRASAARSR